MILFYSAVATILCAMVVGAYLFKRAGHPFSRIVFNSLWIAAFSFVAILLTLIISLIVDIPKEYLPALYPLVVFSFFYLLSKNIAPSLTESDNDVKCKNAANDLGPHIHHQITKAMEVRKQTFQSPEEQAFTFGYLHSLVWDTLNKRGCNDMDLQRKLLQHVCEGVIPQKLWGVVERGEAISSNFFDNSESEYASVKDAKELGVTSGIYDGTKLDDTGSPPDNLRRYLLGEQLNDF